MNDTTELALVTPASMLQTAIEKGIDADGIVKLAETFERMEAKQSEREFTRALIQFQRDCPPVLKTDDGVHRSKYAPLDKIKPVVDPVLWRNGFAATWDTQIHEEKKQVTSTCTLRHEAGHKTSASYTAPIDPAPGMKDIHAVASAVSFAERRALQAVTGITPQRVDDDGKRAAGLGMPPEQLEQLKALLDQTHAWDDKAFWSYCKVDKLEDLATADFARVYTALLTLKRNQEKARKGES